MTTMDHYENFEQIILENFNDIIRKFNLKLVSRNSEFGDEYRLVGTKSELFFTYDRGDLRCSIVNPETKKKYLLNLIYKLLYPRDNEFNFSVNNKPSIQIALFAKLIRERFHNILDGDFSWTNLYDSHY